MSESETPNIGEQTTLELRRLKRSLRSAQNINAELARLKAFKKYSYISKFIPLLLSDDEFSPYIAQNPFPVKVSDLKQPDIIPSKHLVDEVAWSGAIVAHYRNELNEFITLENEFCNSFIYGRYDTAKSVLDKIEKSHGFSLWLIQARLLLLELSEGFAAQRKYSTFISQDEKNDWLVRVLVILFSLKAESASSIDEMRYYFEDSGIKDLGSDISEYIEFKVNELRVVRTGNLRKILLIESNSALIDRYKSLVAVCAQVAENGRDARELQVVRNTISNLEKLIYDSRLATLSLRLTGESYLLDNNRDFRFIELLNLYTEGKYDEFFGHESNKIVDHHNYEYFELLANAAARSGKKVLLPADSVAARLYSYVYGYTSRLSTVYADYLPLRVLAHRYDCLPTFRQLLVGLESKEWKQNDARMDEFIAFHLEGNLFNPRRLLLLRNDYQRKTFRDTLDSQHTSQPALDLYTALTADSQADVESIYKNKKIPLERYLKYIGLLSYRCGNMQKAFAAFGELTQSNIPLSHFEGVEGLINCNIKSRNYSDCVRLVIAEYFLYPQHVYSLPLREIFDAIKKAPPYAEYRDSSFPIFFDLVSRHVDKQFGFMVRDAYEAYLTANGVKRPSELPVMCGAQCSIKDIYYLRHICVPSNMRTSIAFNGTDDVLSERIRICQFLSDQDNSNLKLYSTEIREITQTLVLNRAMTTIEKSKIFVDVEGIKRVLRGPTALVFERYRRYRQISKMLGKEDTRLSIIGDVAGNSKQVLMNSLKDEATNILLLFIRTFRNYFVSSSEYGLDCYLSINIRHGTFVGELRAPFEAAGLVTEKDTATKQYNKNDNWNRAFMFEEKQAWLVERFARLSEEVDAIILHAKDDLIQVWDSRSKPEGLFRYEYGIDDVKELESHINDEDSYEEVIAKVFDMLWRSTDEGLTRVRHELETSMYDAMFSCINTFRVDVSEQSGSVYTQRRELSDALTTVSTNVQESMSRITNWFRLQSSIEADDYLIGLPIRIAEEMSKNVHPRIIFDNQKSIDDSIKLKGSSLTAFANIMYNLFDNVVKHGLRDSSNVTAETTVSFENGKIRIRVMNAVKAESNIIMLRQKITTLNTELINKTDFKLSRVEGGSGITKIRKILEVDLNAECAYKLDLMDDNQFVVLLEWDATKWLA